MFLRLIKLIVNTERQHETYREILFGHQTFSLVDAFKIFDKENQGFITAEELRESFSQFNLLNIDVERIVEVLDLNEDGKVDYMEFSKAVSPRNVAARD